MSGNIQVLQEPLVSTTWDSSLIYSSGLTPVTHFLVERNPEEANLSLSEITTPNQSWKGMCHISSTSTISRPQFRIDDDYEALSENGGHQIVRRVDLSTLASASSISSPLPEPLQPVEVTGDAATVTTPLFATTVTSLSTTSMTTTSTVTGTAASSTSAASPYMDTG